MAPHENSEEDFITQYLAYTADTEIPAFFNRWTAIAGLGAFLGRQAYFTHGHTRINPNLYVMLIGSAGTKKSSAIKMCRKLLTTAGYSKFAGEKTSKEKFLLDLAGEELSADILNSNLFGGTDDNTSSEMFIAADEFNVFIGNGNIEFISLLGQLWDFDGSYPVRFKNSKSLDIMNPTISILGGNTPTGFSQAFPPEIIGQGFFSRLLLVYGEPNGNRIPFPSPPCADSTARLVSLLSRIRATVVGHISLEPTAKNLLSKIYTNWGGLGDVRFDSYSNRRFTHLLKLGICISASSVRREITEYDVIRANTILTHTEHLMPKALGEFGKSRNSDVAHKILQILDNGAGIVTFKQIWKEVHSDLTNTSELGDMLNNLNLAGKLQVVKGGFLPLKKAFIEVSDGTVDYSLLLDEERKYVL